MGANARGGARQLYNAVLDACLEQRLSPGERVAEQVLANQFSVSRTVARQALQRLAADGVLRIEANKGARVATTPPPLAREYLHARRLLESELAALAAPRLGARDRRRLEKLHARELRLLARGQRAQALRLSAEWHFAIAACAGNSPLATAARRVICRCELIVAQYERGGADRGSCCVGHGELIAVLASGDGRAAARAMRTHLADIESRLALDG